MTICLDRRAGAAGIVPEGIQRPAAGGKDPSIEFVSETPAKIDKDKYAAVRLIYTWTMEKRRQDHHQSPDHSVRGRRRASFFTASAAASATTAFDKYLNRFEASAKKFQHPSLECTELQTRFSRRRISARPTMSDTPLPPPYPRKKHVLICNGESCGPQGRRRGTRACSSRRSATAACANVFRGRRMHLHGFVPRRSERRDLGRKARTWPASTRRRPSRALVDYLAGIGPKLTDLESRAAEKNSNQKRRSESDCRNVEN